MVDEDTQVDAIPPALHNAETRVYPYLRVDPDAPRTDVEIIEIDDADLVEETRSTRPIQVRASGTDVGYRAPPLPRIRSTSEIEDDTVTDVEESEPIDDELETVLIEIEGD